MSIQFHLLLSQVRRINNFNYRYTRNSTGSNDLIRLETESSGLRFAIQGFNTQDKISIPLIIYYVGLCFVFLSILPYIIDILILIVHPNRTNIHDDKFILLNKHYRPMKAKAS